MIQLTERTPVDDWRLVEKLRNYAYDKMRARADKPHWLAVDLTYHLKKLEEERREFDAALGIYLDNPVPENLEALWEEAGDEANVLAMLCDFVGMKGEKL